MSRLSIRYSALSIGVAVGALALAACSDSPISPTRSLASDDASFSVTPGTNNLTFASNGTTQFCTAGQVNGDYTIPGTYAPLAGCGTALDLTAALNVYNPGWSQPFAGSSWVGFTAKGGPSSDYRANPGRYIYQETFTIPAGVTAPSLNLNVKSDNVVAVYLNGKLLAGQPNTDCNPGVTCNWSVAGTLNVVDNNAADFNIGGTNTLTFLVIDLPTGFPVLTAPTGGPAPQYGCPTRLYQANGTAGYTSTLVPTAPNHVIAGGGAGTPLTNIGLANQAGCENPTGLDFFGTLSWTPPVVTTWCSPGYWKNHPESWPAGYLTLKYNSFSGVYVRDPKTFVGYDFGKKDGLSDPTLFQVISDPSIYGGPATNNVADILSNKVFGTKIGSGVESCPLN